MLFDVIFMIETIIYMKSIRWLFFVVESKFFLSEVRIDSDIKVDEFQLSFKISTQRQPSQLYQNFFIMHP
jgi:hypothetical protein